MKNKQELYNKIYNMMLDKMAKSFLPNPIFIKKKKCGCDRKSKTIPNKITPNTPSIITTVTMCQKHFIKKYRNKSTTTESHIIDEYVAQNKTNEQLTNENNNSK